MVETGTWATYQFDANHEAFEGLWNQFYKGISSANAAIPIIAKMRDENILDQTFGRSVKR